MIFQFTWLNHTQYCMTYLTCDGRKTLHWLFYTCKTLEIQYSTYITNITWLENKCLWGIKYNQRNGAKPIATIRIFNHHPWRLNWTNWTKMKHFDIEYRSNCWLSMLQNWGWVVRREMLVWFHVLLIPLDAFSRSKGKHVVYTLTWRNMMVKAFGQFQILS